MATLDSRDDVGAVSLASVTWPESVELFVAERYANELGRFCVVEARAKDDPPGVEGRFVVVPVGLVGSVVDGREVVLVADDDAYLTGLRVRVQCRALRDGLDLARRALVCAGSGETAELGGLLEDLVVVLEADGS